MNKRKLLKSVLMAIALTVIIIMAVIFILWALLIHPFWVCGAIIFGMVYVIAREIYKNVL